MEDTTYQELATPLMQPAGQGSDGKLSQDDGAGYGSLHNESPDVSADSNLNMATSEVPTSMNSSRAADLHDFESHFTLRIPTSTVHFRGSILRVIDTDNDQIILQQEQTEENGKQGKILVKRLSSATLAQRSLRVGYTLITILFLGFLFVFCFQVLIFLFVALPVDGGYTSGDKSVHALDIVSTLFSIPVMMYGMASLMAMGSAFVVDTYNGAALFRSPAVEIYYMCVFLVTPVLMFAISLMARVDEPWRVAARAWAILVSITFMIWGLAVTYRELGACFWLVEKHFSSEDDESTRSQEKAQDSRVWKEFKRWSKLANRALILTQTARYSGEKKERYHVIAKAGVSSSLGHKPVETRINLYSRITSLSIFTKTLNIFDTIEPKRVYSSEEVREILPFMTKNNWSMQKMWCMGNSRYNNVVVARGPSALSHNQIFFSVICTLGSSVIWAFFLLGALVWMEMGAGSYIIVALLALLCCIYPIFNNGLEMLRMWDGVSNDTLHGDEEYGNEGADADANLFQVWESFRVTQPKPWYCYLRVSIEVICFFIWPFITMLVKGNYPVAVVFVMLATFTFLWRYFDASAVLSELGSISDATDDTVTHQQKYRMSEVIGRVITNKGRKWWTWIFVVFSLVILFLFLLGNNEEVKPQERARRPPILLVDEFFYPPLENTLAYPTCELSKGFEFPGDMSSDLSDYTYLSSLAYETSEVTSYALSKWFGGTDIVIDEEEFVSTWRETSGTATNPVYFKLFSLQTAPGYAVMSIRGSETNFDWIYNMQLWSASALGQAVKWITPFGWVWAPILPDLIYLVNKVESEAISKVAYYKVTTKFVNEVLAGWGVNIGKNFSNLHVTGASLGGGIAIITGAQTDAFTVAISGPGATLSRETYDPPIELAKLNAQTFNFIPERDFVARIGGRAPFFQNAQCTAPKNDLWGCHSMWRSLCEIAYRCGSNSRPVPCRCVEQFGYPEPVQNGTLSFGEACREANTTWFEMFPPN